MWKRAVVAWLLCIASVAMAVEQPFDPTWGRLVRRLTADGVDAGAGRAG